MSELVARLRNRSSYTEQTSYSGALPDPMLSYFYALVAMAALYAGFWGMRNTMDIQADLSDKGARRSVAPTHKLMVVMGDWTASLLISFGEMLILLAYLVFALKVDFGDQTGYVLLTCLAGSIAGLSFGTVIGMLFRRSEGAKIATLVVVKLDVLSSRADALRDEGHCRSQGASAFIHQSGCADFRCVLQPVNIRQPPSVLPKHQPSVCVFRSDVLHQLPAVEE